VVLVTTRLVAADVVIVVEMSRSTKPQFRDFVVSRQRLLRREAYLMCGDWHRADDLVQITLTKLFASWSRIDDRGPDAYARRILANVVIDERRRPWRREVTVDVLPDYGHEAISSTTSDTRTDLIRALGTLPTGQRVTLVLRFWVDLSVSETADTLGCSTGTVKSQTSRALKALREIVGADDELALDSEETQ
jgi:RNA polymerase sigma-70 factor (sigma-E family)